MDFVIDRVELSGPTLAALSALFLRESANKVYEPIRGLLIGTIAVSEEQISRSDADRDRQASRTGMAKRGKKTSQLIGCRICDRASERATNRAVCQLCVLQAGLGSYRTVHSVVITGFKAIDPTDKISILSLMQEGIVVSVGRTCRLRCCELVMMATMMIPRPECSAWVESCVCCAVYDGALTGRGALVCASVGETELPSLL